MPRQSAPGPSLAICMLFVASMLSRLVSSHPHQREYRDLNTHPTIGHDISVIRRSLSACQGVFAAEGHEARAMLRRKTFTEKLRSSTAGDAEGDIPLAHIARDFEQALTTNHQSSQTGLGAHPSDSSLFGTSGSPCVLQPEVTVGPYWVKGELVRSDITDGQAGVPMYVEYQIVDYKTCEPVPNVYLDIWHANATGVYSGVVAQSNGNSKDNANLARMNNRGIQKTDASGVVAFQTIFPGHYVGRAPHVHLIATVSPTVTAQNTLTGGHVAHVGQAFFDASLASTIYATAPYNSNMQPAMQNKDDDIMQAESAGAGVDPVMRYVWLGNTPSQGLLAWSVVGINTAATYNPHAAGTLTLSNNAQPQAEAAPGDSVAPAGNEAGGLFGLFGL